MQWGELNNIWLMILLVIVIYLSITVYQWRERVKKTFADKELFPFVFPITSSKRYGFKIVAFCVALFFMVIALMDPLYGNRDIQVKREGIDMVFLLDLSSSMNTQDVVPSRLEKSTKLISETLNQLGGDRASLVAFAANAYTISPLTNDYAAIESYLQNVNTELISTSILWPNDVVTTYFALGTISTISPFTYVFLFPPLIVHVNVALGTFT